MNDSGSVTIKTCTTCRYRYIKLWCFPCKDCSYDFSLWKPKKDGCWKNTMTEDKVK